MSSQVNYPGTYLAEHLAGLSHDNVRYFLKTQRFTPRQLWQQVRPQVVMSARGYVLSDDTVLDKHHSQGNRTKFAVFSPVYRIAGFVRQ